MTISNRYGAATLSKTGAALWEIDWLEVVPAHRGQKRGSELMRRVLAWADKKGATLVCFLDPRPGGLTKAQETAWLKRLGFSHCWHVFENSLTAKAKRGMMREPDINAWRNNQ